MSTVTYVACSARFASSGLISILAIWLSIVILIGLEPKSTAPTGAPNELANDVGSTAPVNSPRRLSNSLVLNGSGSVPTSGNTDCSSTVPNSAISEFTASIAASNVLGCVVSGTTGSGFFLGLPLPLLTGTPCVSLCTDI